MRAIDRHLIFGIDPKNVLAEYSDRYLGELTDAEIFDQACFMVATPPARGLTSFTLHAPLEVMARYGLMRLVVPADREFARLQMVASASVYAHHVEPMPSRSSSYSFSNANTACSDLAKVLADRDVDGIEAVVLSIASHHGIANLVKLLAPAMLLTLTGASHSHVGLWLLLRHAEPSSFEYASLLRAGVRALAKDPAAQLKSFQNMSINGTRQLKASPEELTKEILEKLANLPKGTPAGESIRALLEDCERTGIVDSLFGDIIRHDLGPQQIDAAFRAVLRVSAHCMLQDDVEQAKFGWTHCLTMPQSAFGLASSVVEDRRLALAAALVWVTAYRSLVSRQTLDLAWQPEPIEDVSMLDALRISPRAAASRVWHASGGEFAEIRRILATEASVRNDIHLVKYTRACIDMGALDPEHARLYLAAAAHLCAIWIAEAPRATIVDNLLVGRTTP